MENIDRTLTAIKYLKEICRPETKIYLYTARLHPILREIMPIIDGIHYTLHENPSWKDRENLATFQGYIRGHLLTSDIKSYRLFIHNEVSNHITIEPWLWSRIESKPWISEEDCQLPENEKLFIWKE